MTHDALMRILRRKIEKAETIRQWSRDHGVTGSFISNVLAGRKKPPEWLIAALGCEKVVSYRKVK